MTSSSSRTATRKRRLRTIGIVFGIVTGTWALFAVNREPRADAAPTTPAAETYLGTKACTARCHKRQLKQYLADVHRKTESVRGAPTSRKGCEACHGPAKAHKEAIDNDEEELAMVNPAKMSVKQLTQVCARCHAKTVNPVKFLATEHANQGLSCRDCHEVHQKKPTPFKLKKPATELCLSCHAAQKAEFHANAHHPVFEGRIKCVDCHDPHVGAEPAMLKKTQIRELCTSCHREKRGPFVYEHAPNVDQMEDACLTCHKPHGTATDKLTKLSGRGLCVQCHTDIVTDGSHRTRPGTCWQNGCHARIHGSQNHPQFLF